MSSSLGGGNHICSLPLYTGHICTSELLCKVGTITSILQTGKLSPREVKQRVQSKAELLVFLFLFCFLTLETRQAQTHTGGLGPGST